MKMSELIEKAVEYDCGDPRRVNHFMKVYAYAKAIGEGEGLDDNDMYILEAAAVLHDIGIHNAERKYGSSGGKYQEMEGPAVADELLRAAGETDENVILSVCDMVGRHHTYTGIDSLRLRILIEADFLVNIFEDEMPEESVRSVREKIFRTKTGIRLLDSIYLSQRKN